MKELLVSFAVHGVARGQALFHARFRKSLDAIFTVDAIVVGLLANEHQTVHSVFDISRSLAVSLKRNETVSFVEHL